jgi:cytochrome P450
MSQEFFSEAVRRNPYDLYAHLRRDGAVLHIPQVDLWMLLDYDDVKRALGDHEVFSSRASRTGPQGSLNWMIFYNPPRHTKLRALVSKAFTPRMISELEPRIRKLSRELLAAVVHRGHMDLVADYSAQLPMLVIAEMLGIPVEDRATFRRWTEAILTLSDTVSGGENATDATQHFAAASIEMSAYLDQLIKHQESQGTVDEGVNLLLRLSQAEIDGQRLTSADMLGFFQLLLLAGSETTTNLINNAVLCQIEHPDQAELVRRQPELLTDLIEETLRYRSPVQAVFRMTTEDVVLQGRTIPANSLVLPMIGAANRDSVHFDQPERFNVRREPNAHLAFGHGVHFCLGAALARLEARIALADLHQQFSNLELAGSEPWEPRRAFHVHGPSSLPVRFERPTFTTAL